MTLAGGAALSSITGAVLTEGNATYALFSIMLISAGLLAVLAALVPGDSQSCRMWCRP